MHPPGPENEKAPRLGINQSEGEKTDNAENLTDTQPACNSKLAELWPANIARLHAAGIKFEHRPRSHDIVIECPACGGRLIVDEEKPYALCFGSIRCEMSRVPFRAVVAALVGQESHPSKGERS